MNQTANYQLTQWEASDRILMEKFNADNAKIDAALKANADDIAELETALSALSAGTPRIVVGTYTGSGQYGSSHKNTLTFPRKPLAVMVVGGSYQATSLFLRPGTQGTAHETAGSGCTLSLAWGEDSFSWYATTRVTGSNSSASISAAGQLNESGKTYTYLALCEGD